MDARKRKRRRPETTADELKARVDELETELMSARAENQALRNSELRGELVRLDTLTLAIANAGTAANAALEAVPGKVKRAAPEITAQELNEIRLVIATIQNQAAGLDVSILRLRGSTMNREHFEQHAAGIDDAIARAALSLRAAAANKAEDQPVDAPTSTESETARNQAANDLLHTILTARHLLIADDSRHSRDAAVSLLSGAAQAIDRMTALGTEGKASAECSLPKTAVSRSPARMTPAPLNWPPGLNRSDPAP